MPVNPPNSSISFSNDIYWTRFIADLCKVIATSTEVSDAITAAISGIPTVANCEFRAARGTVQTIADSTLTKVQYDTETFDTNSTYDNATNFRHTPTVAGKYLYSAAIHFAVPGSNCATAILLYKNGVAVSKYNSFAFTTGSITLDITELLSMNGTTDYVEVFCLQLSGGNLTILNDATYNKFVGVRVTS